MFNWMISGQTLWMFLSRTYVLPERFVNNKACNKQHDIYFPGVISG